MLHITYRLYHNIKRLLIKLVEVAHYKRRMGQPSSRTYGYNDYVECLLCAVSSDSEDETVKGKR